MSLILDRFDFRDRERKSFDASGAIRVAACEALQSIGYELPREGCGCGLSARADGVMTAQGH